MVRLKLVTAGRWPVAVIVVPTVGFLRLGLAQQRRALTLPQSLLQWPMPFVEEDSSVSNSSMTPSGQHFEILAASFAGIGRTAIEITISPGEEGRYNQQIMRDRYLEILIENQSYILMLYEKFADKKPVMLYDIQERRIYAVPYREYRATLSKRSQISLKKQYDRAMADGDIVVFVKDNEKEKLVSYSLPL